jgi:hypothetical protein
MCVYFDHYSPRSAHPFVCFQAGENRLEVRGLSSVLDTDSARVSGLSDSVRVFDVACAVRRPTFPTEDDPSEELRRLRAKKSALESEKRCAFD